MTPGTPKEPVVLDIDNHLLVLGKPAGFLSQADDTGDPDIISWSKAYLKAAFSKPGNVFAGLVHRLDRPASGVMVVARTSKAAARLTAQWQDRTPKKRYVALVQGTLRGSGRLEDYLFKDGRNVRVVSSTSTMGKRAVLNYSSLGVHAGKSLVEIQLETGRPHQIRVQFAHLGYPLIGDLRYGSQMEFDGKNLALHALSLTFDHPTLKAQRCYTWREPLEAWEPHFPEILASIKSIGKE